MTETSGADLETVLLLTLFTIVLIIGVIGNGLVIYIAGIRSHERHRSAFNDMIYYLAVVDLVSIMVIPTVNIYRMATNYKTWHFGSFGCHFLTGFVPLSMMISIGMILLITVDRCRIICSPYKREITQREARISIAMVFVFSLIFVIPRMVFTPKMATRIEITFVLPDSFTEEDLIRNSVGSSLPQNGLFELESKNKSVKIYTGYERCQSDTVQNEFRKVKGLMEKDSASLYTSFCREAATSDCLVTKSKWYLHYDVVLKLTRDIIFILVLCISNALIYRKLYDKESQRVLGDRQSIHNHRQNTFRMLIAMATVFVLLVLPKDIFDLVFDISWLDPPGLDMVSSHALTTVNKLLLLLQTCNCICNVFIYARLNRKFRKILNDLSLKKKRAYTLSLTLMSQEQMMNGQDLNELRETAI